MEIEKKRKLPVNCCQAHKLYYVILEINFIHITSLMEHSYSLAHQTSCFSNFTGDTIVTSCPRPLRKEVYSKRINYVVQEAKSTLLDQTPFNKGGTDIFERIFSLARGSIALKRIFFFYTKKNNTICDQSICWRHTHRCFFL